jgi:AcrR family transcriptional regulator
MLLSSRTIKLARFVHMDNEMLLPPKLNGVAERKSSDQRRDEIVRATLRLVATKGFTGVTLRDVATEVGVVHGLIRHYFATRDELVAAAFDFAV